MSKPYVLSSFSPHVLLTTSNSIPTPNPAQAHGGAKRNGCGSWNVERDAKKLELGPVWQFAYMFRV